MSLQAGRDALTAGRYQEAVRLLEQFCRDSADSGSKEYIQALMGLIQAYPRLGQKEKAIALGRRLAAHEHPQVSSWAKQALNSLEATNETQPQNSAETQNLKELLNAGQAALKQRRDVEAIEAFEAFCQGCSDPSSKDYVQAQMGLVKAYQRTHQIDQAIALCQQLATNVDPLVQSWVQQVLPSLLAAQTKLQNPVATTPEPLETPDSTTPETASRFPKAGRAAQVGVKLAMKGVAANLAMASSLTIGLLFGMLLVSSLSVLLIVDSKHPSLGLGIAVSVTLIFTILSFFLSPLLMDLVQSWLYGTRWVSLSEVERYSPEAAAVIQRVCQQKNLQQPRLGIISDQNPTAFTYGSLPNSARLVVSQGLFTYLDDDEIATVYAHELGHIVHWDFAVMTLGSALVQITYLVYTYAKRLGRSIDDKRFKAAVENAALTAYIFYIIGTYLLLYLSRTREYYADHFAAETTGNPNALSRALVKIAYGILEEGKRTKEPSQLIQGTRALGIYDPKAANATGTAYRVATEPQKVGRVFLWDMFNPWAWWMELASTHPLTGKRVRALSNYAEQMGLATEFDIALVVREGKQLNKKKLYGNFAFDVVLYTVDIIGAIAGLLLGLIFFKLGGGVKVIPSMALIGFGLGTLVKMIVMYPDFKRAPETNVLALMSDPYASPFRGQAVKLQGQIIGRGDAGYKFGSDLKLQDETGMIYLHYASRFGPLGNFLFGLSQAENQVGAQVTTVGWFRRGMAPWIDLMQMDTNRGWNVKSYHRFWLLVLGIGAIALGFVFPSLF